MRREDSERGDMRSGQMQAAHGNCVHGFMPPKRCCPFACSRRQKLNASGELLAQQWSNGSASGPVRGLMACADMPKRANARVHMIAECRSLEAAH